MGATRWTLGSLLALGMAVAVHAATQKVDIEQSSLAKSRELSLAVMNRIVAGDDQGALELLRPHLPVPKNEFQSMRDKAIEHRRTISGRFGKTLGYKLVREERVSDFIIRLTYVEKRENHFLRWQFSFYRPRSEWRLNSFNWDDNLEALISQACVSSQ